MILVTLSAREKPSDRQGSLILRISGKESRKGVWKIINILMSILIGLTIVGLWVHFS